MSLSPAAGNLENLLKGSEMKLLDVGSVAKRILMQNLEENQGPRGVPTSQGRSRGGQTHWEVADLRFWDA